MAQNWSSTVDVLGAHNNQGRGCAGCHAPHSGSFGSGHGGAADAGSYALWGQDASPLYGKTIAFGDSGRFTEVLPTSITTGSTEVGGILLCLSCHDGNLTASNMMTNQSYEQTIGLLTNTAYGTQPIPTLLGNDGTTAGNYTNDHPVGVNATISTTSASAWSWANGKFTVTPGTPYAQFVANYGWPALAPGKWSQPLRRQRRRQALCGLHHLPQPARDDGLHVERCEPDRGRRRRQVLRHLLLRERPIQPEPSDVRQHHGTFDDTVLPSVPLWRSERSQQHQHHHDAVPVEIGLNPRGRELLSPFFLR